MTSSLVGSEMCIRDSLMAICRAAAQGSNSAGSCPAACLTADTAMAGAVSYTHLTLPTICSV
eukprot:8569115-Prorocentrum_lima.AAC.1